MYAISLALCMKSFKKNLSGLLLYCNTFTSHMRSSKSYVHLCPCKNFHVSRILKPNMIFPLLPALRSQATLTSASEITLCFLSSFKSESFHFLHNTGHIRKNTSCERVFYSGPNSWSSYRFYLSLLLYLVSHGIGAVTIQYKIVFLNFTAHSKSVLGK